MNDTDKLGRRLKDLRISVTDRCNFRCRYCMPSEKFGNKYKFLPSQELLSFDEIERLARLFVTLGADKLRLTGGEPLLRRDLPVLVQKLARIKGVSDLALTTNGFLLAASAAKLRAAGLQRLNVSLDAIDEELFQEQSGTGHSVSTVLDGIKSAQSAGFADIKLNAVIRRGINESQILPLAEYAREAGCTLRFIEYMDVGTLNGWQAGHMVSAESIISALTERYQLEPLGASYAGEVAKRYRYADGAGEVGFVTSVSAPFCADCTRARLTADGKLVLCLFSAHGVSLRDRLRSGESDTELLAHIQQIWRGRSDRYSEIREKARSAQQQRADKIEMYYVGG